MPSLQEILAEFDLADVPVQTKTASAAAPATTEVSEMLKNLGLEGAEAGVTKVANETNVNKGEHMSLEKIYGEFFGEAAPAEQTVEKTASETTAPTEEGTNEASELFGELTAHYLNEGIVGLFKSAGSVESHAGAGELPQAHATTGGQLTNIIGAPKDPHLPMNHSASGGAPLKVMNGNTSPYSLPEAALKKQILKKMQAASVGEFKD